MAIARLANVAIPAGANGGTSGAIDTTGATLIILHSSFYIGSAGTAVTDSKSNSYNIASQAASAVENFSALFYCLNPTVGAGHTFTLSGTGVFSCGQVAAYSNGADVDQLTGALGVGNSTIQPGSVTPTENNELVMTGISADSPSTTFSIDSGFSITDQTAYAAGNNEGGALAELIQTSAAAANPTWSFTGPVASVATTIATFKLAAAGGGVFIPIIGRGPGMNLAGQGGGLIGRAHMAAMMRQRMIRRMAHVSR